MWNKFPTVALLGAMMIAVMSQAQAERRWIDLTHPVPTFLPVEGDPLRTDYGKPWLNSIPHVTWYQQAILTISHYSVSTVTYPSGKLVIDEHYGTHLDAPNHVINKPQTMAEHGIPNEERRDMSQLTPEDLIGPVVLIDIGNRVRAELEKNGGRPSPDRSVTDFSDDSGNVVTAADIDAIADQLVDGAWIVVNMDWARFFFDGDYRMRRSAYFNNFNHPGLNREAVDRLVQIIDERNLELGGIAVDNINVDTGQGNWGTGASAMKTDPWYSHTVLLQRDVLIIDNLANVQELADVMNDGAGCTLVVGALKHVRGTGGFSRVFAMCES